MKKFLTTVSIYLLPFIVFAQANVDTLLGRISVWINDALPILMSLAVLLFVWGVVVYIFNAGNEEKRKQARGYMIWGVIGLFVIVSVWGLVSFIGSSTGINQGVIPIAPVVPQ